VKLYDKINVAHCSDKWRDYVKLIKW